MSFVDKDSAIPYYLQLANTLRGQISSGAFDSGELLPSERELCDSYNVSRSTVRQAIQLLREEGLIRKERGVGTRIERRPKIEQDLLGYHNFDLQMLEKGYTASVSVLNHEVLTTPGRVQRLMRLAEGEPVFKVVRLRSVNSEPVFIEKIYMPLARFPDLRVEDFLKTDIFLKHLGSEYSTRLGDAKVFVEPVILDEGERKILEIKDQLAAGLMFERISFDSQGEAVAITKRVFRGDRCRHLLVIKGQ